MRSLPSFVKHVGITGTRRGMTEPQKEKIAFLTAIMRPWEYSHGDAIGADSEFHDIVSRRPKAFIIVHPPENPKYRAFREGNIIKKPLPYLVRNGNIVKSVDLMLATPRLMEEELRSGTWAAIRFSRKIGKPLIIIWPDGSVSEERLDKLHLEEEKQNVLDFD